MKLNLVVLLTDLFNLFEIHPAKCVCYPGMDGQGKWRISLSSFHSQNFAPHRIYPPKPWTHLQKIGLPVFEYQSGACFVVQVYPKYSCFAFRFVFVFPMICFRFYSWFYYEELVNKKSEISHSINKCIKAFYALHSTGYTSDSNYTSQRKVKAFITSA